MKRTLLSALVLSAVALFLYYDHEAAAAAFSALSACIRQIVPSLFPYMVLSSLIVSLELAAPLCRVFPMHVFGLPSCTAPVLLTGLLCGFPVGAVGCAALSQSGKITKREAAHLCALSCHTSPAFLLGVVGTAWGSKSFALLLYGTCVAFAVVYGVLFRPSRCNRTTDRAARAIVPHPKLAPAFCRAVCDAASSCLTVTGFIVFFRTASAVIATAVPLLTVPCAILLEFSSGALYGAQVGGAVGAGMTGFAVGFSGLSVLAQLLQYLAPQDIPFKPVLYAKLCEGLLTAATAILRYLRQPLQPAANTRASSALLSAPALLLPLCLLLLLWYNR